VYKLQRFALTATLAAWATVWAAISVVTVRGSKIMDPYSVDWLLSGDSGQSFIGWMAFLNSPWRFPFGVTTQNAIPIQTSLVFTDSIPLLAIPAKLILGAIHHQGLFQWFGIWTVLCLTLSYGISWQLLKYFSVPLLARLPGAMVLSLNPSILLRPHHMALQAHWVVLWCFYAILREFRRQRSNPNWLYGEFSCIVLCATLIHPYLAAIAWIVLNATLVWRLRRQELPAAVAITCGSVMTAVSLLAMWLVGYFVDADLSAVPLEFYPVDGLALINPFHTSAFIPKLRATQQSLEGFAYPGIAILVVLALFWVRRGTVIFREFGPLFAGCGVTLLLSFSPYWHLGGNRFISFDAVLSAFEPIWLTFRSTGRFVWPAYYLVLLSALVIPFRCLEKKRAVFLIWVIAIVQATEFSSWLIERRVHDAANTQKQTALRLALNAQYEEYASLGHPPTHVRLIPPYIPFQETSCTVDPALSDRVFYAAASVALSKRIPINSGVFARFNGKKALEHCTEQTTAWSVGQFDPSTFYVLEPGIASRRAASVGLTTECFAQEFAPYCLASRDFGAIKSSRSN
jgi:hypothetical protein